MDFELELQRNEYWGLMAEGKRIEAYRCVETNQELAPLAIYALILSGVDNEKCLKYMLKKTIGSQRYALRDTAALIDAVPDNIWQDSSMLEIPKALRSLTGDMHDGALACHERISLCVLKASLWHGQADEAKSIARDLGETIVFRLKNERDNRVTASILKVACLSGENIILAGEPTLAIEITEIIRTHYKSAISGDIAVGFAQTLFRLRRFTEAADAYRIGLAKGSMNRLMRIYANQGIGRCGLMLGSYTSTNLCKTLISKTGRYSQELEIQRRWRREAGCTILVEGEQGLGEEIFYFRMITLLSQKYNHNHFVLRPSAALTEIIREWFPTFRVMSSDIDKRSLRAPYRIGATAIPLYLGFDELLANISGMQDVNTPSEPPQKWQNDRERRIGIVWRSSRTRFGPQKTVGFQLLKAALCLEGVKLVSLQHNLEEEERKYCEENNISYIDSAASGLKSVQKVLSGIDCVIGCSTVVSHLSAAMNVKTIVLLSKIHANTWMWNHDSSGKAHWYSNARILTQEEYGCWIKPIKIALEECVSSFQD